MLQHIAARYKCFVIIIIIILAQVTSGGSILLGSKLLMTSRERTFSLAVSRAMSPAAHVLVYCVVQGEVLTDSINFFVRDTQLSTVQRFFQGGHLEERRFPVEL